MFEFFSNSERGGSGHSVIGGSGGVDRYTHRSRLTPDLAFLPEGPIVLPLFPDPFRACASFPNFAIVGFDRGEDSSGYLVIAVGIANDQ